MPPSASISRNDPCPCGSGKKYKKCCLGKAGAASSALAGGRAAGAVAAGPSAAQLIDIGAAHHRARRHDAAERAYRDAILANPRDPRAHFHLGQLLSQIERRADAIAALERAVALDPEHATAWGYLAATSLREGRADRALEAGRRAAELAPDAAIGHTIVGACEERRNRLDAAGDSFERAIKAEPTNLDALLALACLRRRQSRHEDAESLLRRLLAQDPVPEFSNQAWKELGVVLDRLGRHHEAFRALEEGGRACLRTAAARDLDLDVPFQRIAAYRAGITAELLARFGPDELDDGEPDPGFLVGFPRSGTTMTEQILDAHPGITTSDERPYLRRVKDRLRERLGSGSIPELLARADRDDLAAGRAEYRAAVREEHGDLAGRVFIDKLPLHLIDLGLIDALFPRARVLLALRDPRDVCLSCFTQRFGLNPAMANFLDWERTGRLYDAVMDLRRHLEPMLRLSMLTIRYEDTVTDLAGQGRRMLEHLDLAWDDELLQFHNRAKEKFISTPSYAAVTQPVNRGAIGRWRPYADRFERIDGSLRPWIEAYGYESE